MSLKPPLKDGLLFQVLKKHLDKKIKSDPDISIAQNKKINLSEKVANEPKYLAVKRFVNNYPAHPDKQILNTLSKFLEYEDWEDFKIKNILIADESNSQTVFIIDNVKNLTSFSGDKTTANIKNENKNKNINKDIYPESKKEVPIKANPISKAQGFSILRYILAVELTILIWTICDIFSIDLVTKLISILGTLGIIYNLIFTKDPGSKKNLFRRKIGEFLAHPDNLKVVTVFVSVLLVSLAINAWGFDRDLEYRGSVFDSKNQGVKNVSLIFYTNGLKISQTQSNEQGEFFIAINPQKIKSDSITIKIHLANNTAQELRFDAKNPPLHIPIKINEPIQSREIVSVQDKKLEGTIFIGLNESIVKLKGLGKNLEEESINVYAKRDGRGYKPYKVGVAKIVNSIWEATITLRKECEPIANNYQAWAQTNKITGIRTDTLRLTIPDPILAILSINGVPIANRKGPKIKAYKDVRIRGLAKYFAPGDKVWVAITGNGRSHNGQSAFINPAGIWNTNVRIPDGEKFTIQAKISCKLPGPEIWDDLETLAISTAK